jgi:ketosteroid isomerase-like protein
MADDTALLQELNANYVRSAEEGDLGWYGANLADDYLCSTADGKITDKQGFLQRIGRGSPGSRMQAVDVRIRLLGDVALIHAGFRYRKPDGAEGTGRYTDIWARRDGRWLCVSAHFNRF